MLRSSVIRSVGRLSLTSSSSLVVGSVVVPRLSFNNQFNGIRFKSTTSPSSGVDAANEIQTQLPSFDEIASNAGAISEQVSQAVNMTSDQIGYMNSIGLAQSWTWPPDLIQHFLEYIHVYTGLPWWGTICAATLLVRLAMFPLYVKSSDTIARNSRIKPELDIVTKDLMSAGTLLESQTIALKRKKLLADNGIQTRWLAAPMLQLPVALGFFSGIRAMANYPVDGFTTQGLSWFTDLTQADPYLGLQFITAGVLMTFTRLGGETGAQQFSPAMKKFFTILPLISIPATMNLSAGVVLYFAVNGTFSVMQTVLLRNKTVRKKLGISDIVIHPTKPGTEQKGIIASLKENMANARDQAEKKQAMRDKEQLQQEMAKERKKNSKVKIVRRDSKKH
ncbi:hypothetical protein Kpol_1055p34 [Vanderwaltozyma polyspora DSM 70294]|uniref:Membrane insertase YidC/Oxa/ALB C-terminal domain-containing protein n=1 Tax=Vanderwaltozyma polyspora (strain ATCC 22028 / DSM 70294 / BCRC 21397 / CBS 2163 / NBRC 10782 / NRRL Y-8283 / UCD 57-17) TaxID=436907 RepID=A7TGA9_VANPO|nr:uncharacterized protein Kpol_1055p34 [Vanderwaltozyma polyspora DSM 70294]EDO18679.1 hypothetical protein Kpol_1055p34 [Vanderwaltozyma polyspora DSM 70294]